MYLPRKIVSPPGSKDQNSQAGIEMALPPPPPLTQSPAVVIQDSESADMKVGRDWSERDRNLDPATKFGFVSPGIPLMDPSQIFGTMTTTVPRKASFGSSPSSKPSPYYNFDPAAHGLHYHGRGISYFDRVDRPRFPWIVPTLLVIHAIVFIITMYENDCPANSLRPDKCVLQFLGRLSFQPLNENPLLGPSYRSLLHMGALESNLVTNGGEGWRLAACVWLHAGLFHLIANMIGLLSLGMRLERDFGGLRVGIIYFMSGFGGSLLSALFMQNQISVGASGALMGLLGATVAEMLINWTNYRHRSRSLAALVLAVTLSFSFGLMPHVDNLAHVGGFVAGFLLGFIFLVRPRFAWIKQRCCFPMIHDSHTEDSMNGGRVGTVKHTRLQVLIWSLALVFLLLGYTAAILSLFKGFGFDNRRTCRWCHYMSCIPSNFWRCQSGLDISQCTVSTSPIHGSLRLVCSRTNQYKDWPNAVNATDSLTRALCTRTCI